VRFWRNTFPLTSRLNKKTCKKPAEAGHKLKVEEICSSETSGSLCIRWHYFNLKGCIAIRTANPTYHGKD
jgi:hypothetical protein